MNKDFEILIKLIVPALVLIAWAINQMTSKEAPPVPKRPPLPPGRPPGGLPPAPMPGERLGPREVIWTEAPPPPPRRELPAGPDEIIILGTETRPVRPSSGRPTTQPRARGPRRPRPAQAPRPEPPRPKPPLSSPVTTTGLGPTSAEAQRPAPLLDRPQSAGIDLDVLRAALASPSRIREVMMLNEILQPPRALRPRGRG
jgi:hypothetical protein